MMHFLKFNLGVLTSIPGVVARGPWQIPREGGIEVKNGPGQNNNVVEIQQADYDLCAITKTCVGDRASHE